MVRYVLGALPILPLFRLKGTYGGIESSRLALNVPLSISTIRWAGMAGVCRGCGHTRLLRPTTKVRRTGWMFRCLTMYQVATGP